MRAEDLINGAIPPLKPTDTIQTAINWMDKFRMIALPVVQKGVFLGLLSEKIILDTKLKKEALVGNVHLDVDAFVKPHQHFYDVIKIASKNQSNLVAVLDEDKVYLGVISIKDTVGMFSQMSAIQGPGAILVLSMEERSYSLTEISRLIEENNVKILSLHMTTDITDPSQIKLTIKLNTTDPSRVIATLTRFDYNIVATFQAEELQQNDSDRLDLLFKYLNI